MGEQNVKVKDKTISVRQFLRDIGNRILFAHFFPKILLIENAGIAGFFGLVPSAVAHSIQLPHIMPGCCAHNKVGRQIRTLAMGVLSAEMFAFGTDYIFGHSVLLSGPKFFSVSFFKFL